MKIENPTEFLAETIRLFESDGHDDNAGNKVARRLMRLHDHVVGGGALPAQWRAPGTAAGALTAAAAMARENIGASLHGARQPHNEIRTAESLRSAMAAVEGK